MLIQREFRSERGRELTIKPKINIFGSRRVTAAIALLILICGAPVYAWCASANLWVSNDGDAVESYTAKQLKKKGEPTPANLSTFRYTTGLAFDKSNNLWSVVYDSDAFENKLVLFTAAQLKNLKNDENPTPEVIITSTGSFRLPLGCNFDHQGNLWVVDFENDSIDEFSKSQLAAGSAEVTPAAVITSNDLDGPDFVTFDATGNAWVDNELGNSIAEFSVSQLTSGGSKSAAVVLTDDGSDTSIRGPGEIAFDKKGDLWVPNYVSNTVVEFAKSQLSSSGDPAPIVKLNSFSFDGPWGAAFENSGNLVIVNNNDGAIFELTTSQLKTSGKPVPKVTVTEPSVDNFQVIFGPAS